MNGRTGNQAVADTASRSPRRQSENRARRLAAELDGGNRISPLVFGSMFSGVGLLDLGLCQAGIQHAWFCERDEFRRGILCKRWPGVPVLDDVRDVGLRTVERVDGIVGGFPCKGISGAGRREGFGHPETVLWREMARAIRELQPRYVVVENVADLLSIHDGAVWGEVLGDLAALGFDVEWDVLPAAAVGAPHLRQRVFAVACHPNRMAGRVEDAAGREVAQPGEVERAIGPNSDAHAIADSARVPEGRAGAQAGVDGERVRQGAHATADTNGRGGEAGPEQDPRTAARQSAPSRDDLDGRGVRVEWGDYEPAIRRWEAVHGPAPEPLVRRVDDRGAARVDRSRLSALGDGVQVQVGGIVGEYVMELERWRKP